MQTKDGSVTATRGQLSTKPPYGNDAAGTTRQAHRPNLLSHGAARLVPFVVSTAIAALAAVPPAGALPTESVRSQGSGGQPQQHSPRPVGAPTTRRASSGAPRSRSLAPSLSQSPSATRLFEAEHDVAMRAARVLSAAGKLALRAVDIRAAKPPAVLLASSAAGTQAAARSGRPAGRAQPKPAHLLQYLGTFLVTCYDLSGTTASGAPAGPQSVAVDPGVISLGTQIYVQGVGVRTADDTGGAIIGHHIDIWEPTYWQCADWGVQERAVYAVSPAGT